MKLSNYILIVLAILSLTITSCGDDDSIIGSWVLSSATLTECTDTSANDSLTYSATPCTDASPDRCTYVVLAFTETTYSQVANFAFDGMLESETSTGTYTKDGDRYTICIDNECLGFTITFDGDQFTMVSDADKDDDCVTRLFATKQ